MNIGAWLLMVTVGVPLAFIAVVLVAIAVAHLVTRCWGDR